MQPSYPFAIFFDGDDGASSSEQVELDRPLTTGETVALESGDLVVVTEIIKQSQPGGPAGRARGYLKRRLS